jgi:hypothetical protein
MHREEIIYRNTLIRTLNTLTWCALVVGICLLAAYIVLAGDMLR